MVPTFRLRFLGAVQVEQDGKPVRGLRSRKALALLGYLAVQEQPVPREQIAALFWPDQPERNARANLSWILNHLTRRLSHCLEANQHTVQFCCTENHWVDLEVFRALEAQENVAALNDAVELYRGEFLEGLALRGCAEFELWLTGERERWRERATRVLAQLITHHRQRGETEPALRHAQRLLALEPWHEEAHRQAMELLAKSGQRSAALAQYEACRRVLAKELRVEPMPETTALYERIRTRSTAPHHNLPVQPTPFVGRAAQVAELIAQLNRPDCRLLTILGPGGIGKTRLALEAASRQADAFFEGVFFIPLAAVHSPDLLVPAMADALGFSFSGARDPLGQLLNYLRHKQVLLILDSFEHLVEGAELIGAILQQAAQVQMLVTSRARLNLRWEWCFPLEGMAAPSLPATVAQEGLKFEEYEAVQLFQQTARRANRQFALSKSERAAIAHICQMVEGLPLAIELAASWVGARTCAEIAGEIEHGLGLAPTDLRDVPARHRSVQATIDYSWEMLTPEEQRVFMALSVFRRGCSSEAAQAVTGATPPTLASLVNKSLLRLLPVGRYEMHELLRQYAAERLAAQPEAETRVRDEHCAYYALFLQLREDALFGSEAVQTQAAVRAEMDNVRAAWDWAVTQARVEEIERSLNGLTRFYDLVGPFAEGDMLMARAVERVRGLEQPDTLVLLSRLLSARAGLQMLQGLHDQALATAQEAIELATRANATDAMALGYLRCGNTLVFSSAFEAARIKVEQALALARLAHLPLIEAECLNILGQIAWRLEEFAQARPCFEQAERICDAINYQRGKSYALISLGSVYRVQGDYASALHYFEQALSILRQIGDRQRESVALINLGLIANHQGDYGMAKRHYEESLRVARDLGNRYVEGSGLVDLGYVAFQQGDYASAEDDYRRGMHIDHEIGDRLGESIVLSCLGLLYHHQGKHEAACQSCQQALQIAQEVGSRHAQAYALTRLGHALAGFGRLAQAAEAYQQALELRRALGQHSLAMEVLAGWARVSLAQDDLSQAQTRVDEILKYLETYKLHGTDEPFRIYLTCYQVLCANQDARAKRVLATARRLLREHAARIGDPAMRRSFLENVPHHREIARQSRAHSHHARGQ